MIQPNRIIDTAAPTFTHKDLSDRKQWLRITDIPGVVDTAEDTLINNLYSASLLWAEGETKKRIRFSDREAYLNGYGIVEIVGLNVDVESIEIIAEDETDFAALDIAAYTVETYDSYAVIKFDSELIPTLESGVENLKILFTEGYESYVSVPDDILSAIDMKAMSLYDGRVEANKRYVTSAEMLLRPYKDYTIL